MPKSENETNFKVQQELNRYSENGMHSVSPTQFLMSGTCLDKFTHIPFFSSSFNPALATCPATHSLYIVWGHPHYTHETKANACKKLTCKASLKRPSVPSSWEGYTECSNFDMLTPGTRLCNAHMHTYTSRWPHYTKLSTNSSVGPIIVGKGSPSITLYSRQTQVYKCTYI